LDGATIAWCGGGSSPPRPPRAAAGEGGGASGDGEGECEGEGCCCCEEEEGLRRPPLPAMKKDGGGDCGGAGGRETAAAAAAVAAAAAAEVSPRGGGGEGGCGGGGQEAEEEVKLEGVSFVFVVVVAVEFGLSLVVGEEARREAVPRAGTLRTRAATLAAVEVAVAGLEKKVSSSFPYFLLFDASISRAPFFFLSHLLFRKRPKAPLRPFLFPRERRTLTRSRLDG